MKRVGYLIDKIADVDNLYEAFYQARRGKLCKAEVQEYQVHLEENTAKLRQQILAGDIKVGNYHYFTIYDPKERVICAAEFSERVLHHAIINICLPYFDRTLIDTTYASRKGKGVYAAVDKAVQATTRHEYTAKLDVRKYYDSIDHQVLKHHLRRMFKDGRLLQMFDSIIDSYQIVEGKGLPIGNLTSQYFANAYLSPLDHYAKEQLHVPEYVRYMDDILLAGDSKREIKEMVDGISQYAKENLSLTLKPPVCRQQKDGQIFLGYRILPYRYELSGRSKKRYRSKMIMYDKNLREGIWDEQTYQKHILPLTSFVQHAVSARFRASCIERNMG